MAFDNETRAELKAIVKEAVAEVLGEAGPVVGGGTKPSKWPHRDNFSPPRADGAVQLRFVEEELVEQYGAEVVYKELTIDGVVQKSAPIPRWFFVPEHIETKTAEVNVSSAAFRGNRAYEIVPVEYVTWLGQKRTRYDEGSQISDAFASQWKYEDLRARMTHLAARIAGQVGNAYTLYNIPENELTIG